MWNVRYDYKNKVLAMPVQHGQAKEISEEKERKLTTAKHEWAEEKEAKGRIIGNGNR